MMKKPLEIQVERARTEPPPDHHVLPKPCAGPEWLSYFSGVPDKRRRRASKKAAAEGDDISGFKNPWPSFHKATRQELWQSLEWGEDTDPAIDLAASHLPDASPAAGASISRDRLQQAAGLLQVEKPDFSFDPDAGNAKTTWLGHAGVLLQLPALEKGGRPVRVIFDPIFSERASPSQRLGPTRSYAPPCRLEELPPVDLLLVSHNHYDHLDYDTVTALWRLNKEHMRFVVPLRNARYFTDAGVPADRVTELDWWDAADLAEQGGGPGRRLRVTCTPAQHSSARDGSDADSTLWSGWYLQHEVPERKPYRVFFAGDSGYQYHADPAWPPKVPKSTTHSDLERGTTDKITDPDNSTPPEKYPPCPAYREIATRLGAPDLLCLPVALGATWAYLRSFFSDYLPPAGVPFPRHSAGMTGAIHMPPWDAARALRDLAAGDADDGLRRPPVAVAVHWGTFVTEPVEVLKTLGLLEWACYNQGVRFGRRLEEGQLDAGRGDGRPVFLAINHGQSVVT